MRTIRATVFTILATAACAGALAQAAKVRIDIPSQPVRLALKDLGEQTGLQIVFRAEDMDKEAVLAPAIAGDFSATEALEKVLARSHLKYEFVNRTTIFISSAEPSTTISAAPASGQEEPERPLVLAQRGQRETDAAASRTTRAPEMAERDVSGGVAELQEVVVTGTHIRGIRPPGYRVDSYNRQDILQSGYSTVAELMQSIPQNLGNVGANTLGLESDTRAGNPGGTSVDLRGFGADATLVLVNGHRMAPAGPGGRIVDVSTIPLDMVERVEVLPDGASALYGSDAVGGVVNYVLRKHASGSSSLLHYGTTTRGGGQETIANQSFGTEWSTGGGMLAANYTKLRAISAEQRSFSDGQGPFDLTPDTRLYSLMAAGHQEIGDKTEASFDALYSNRDTDIDTLSLGVPFPTVMAVDQTSVSTRLDHWLTVEWSLAASATYGHNSSLIENANGIQRAASDLYVGDVKLDGPIATLPAGIVHVAIGAQYRHEGFTRNLGGDFAALGDISKGRSIWSGYAELYAPLSRSVDLGVAGRYERYSDFGSSFDPQAGIGWRLTKSIKLRGTVGRSFRAPQFDDLFGYTSAILLNVPDPEATSGLTPALFVSGSNPELTAQRATTWTVGFDIAPTANPDWSISGTYFNTKFKNRIDAASQGLLLFDPLAHPEYSVFFQRMPDPGLVSALAATPNFFNLTEIPIFGPARDLEDVTFLVDDRYRNLSSQRIDGIDLDVRYSADSSGVEWSSGLKGTYILHLTQQLATGVPEIALLNTIFNPVDLRLRAFGAARWKHWSVAAAINYTDDYKNNAVVPTSKITSFPTVDLQVGREFALANKMTITATVNAVNVLDRLPPSAITNFSGFEPGYDPANANPRGRFLSVDLRVAF